METVLKILQLYLAAFVLFLIIDLIWLGAVARNLYRDQLGHLLAPQVNWTAAIVFYALFVGGLVYFAIWPGLQAESARRALLNGALYGLLTYATYELTNLATLHRWPLAIVPVDILWGAALGASVSWLTAKLFLAWGG